MIEFPDGTRYKKQAPPAPAGLRFRVLGDRDSRYWGFKPRAVAPDPAVNFCGEFESRYFEPNKLIIHLKRADLYAAWQWYRFDLLALSKYKKLRGDLTKAEFSYILRAFKGTTNSRAFINDGAGTDKYNCAPCGGVEARRPAWPKQDAKVCADAIVTALEVKENAAGIEMVRLYGFDYRSTPPKPDLKDPRNLRATWITANGEIRNFTHLGGAPVYYPFLLTGPTWFPKQLMVAV